MVVPVVLALVVALVLASRSLRGLLLAAVLGLAAVYGVLVAVATYLQ